MSRGLQAVVNVLHALVIMAGLCLVGAFFWLLIWAMLFHVDIAGSGAYS